MMKKISVAVAAAMMAGAAAAADVTLYGVVDLGFSYLTHRKTEGGNVLENSKSFSMESGQSAGSRWGLKGSEDLGNGLKVGFVLESGFSADTGKLPDDRLFNREATISLSGSFGEVYFGRMGSMITDVGSVGWYGAVASPFGTGVGDYIEGHAAVMAVTERTDNTIAYMSPRFGGLQLSLQYSMGNDNSNENKPKTDRYIAVGADYQLGNFEIAGLIDYKNKKSDAIDTDKLADAFTFNLAANYDCGFAKSFIAAQYFKDVSALHWQSLDSYEKDNRLISYKGYGVNIGVDIPAFGGDFLASVGYADGDKREAKKKSGDITIYSALVGYFYPLSKRTSLYAAAGMTSEKTKLDSGSTTKDRLYQVMGGITHTF